MDSCGHTDPWYTSFPKGKIFWLQASTLTGTLLKHSVIIRMTIYPPKIQVTKKKQPTAFVIQVIPKDQNQDFYPKKTEHVNCSSPSCINNSL